MPIVEIKVNISIDGRPVQSFDPYIYRQSVDETEAGRIELDSSGSLQSLGLAGLATLTLIAAKATADMSVYFGTSIAPDASDAHAVIRAGGLILAVNMQASSGPGTNFEVLIADDATAVDYVGAGT